MKRILTTIMLAMLCLGGWAQVDTAFMQVVDTSYAHLIFPGSKDALRPVHEKLYDLRKTPGASQNLNILHIGGSHVQAGMLTNAVRMPFEPWAEHGLLFPFRAIKTNGSLSYRFDYTGMWKGSRCVNAEPDVALGLAGAAAITSDQDASITLRLRDEGRWDFDRLTVLGEVSDSTVMPYLVTSANDTVWADALLSKREGNACEWRFVLSQQDSVVTLHCQGLTRNVDKTLSKKLSEKRRRQLYTPLQDKHYFVLRGMIPDSHRHGVTYSESGVNGAAVPSWLRTSAHFEQELALLPPDLVVFGIGINDANVPQEEFDTAVFKRDYRQLMQRIRTVSPDVRFIWITNNDCAFTIGKGKKARKIPNPNTELVRQSMLALAQEEDGAVLDVYGLMGGLKSSIQWHEAGLMQKDRIHFTRAGYEQIGGILYNAIDEDYKRWNRF